MEYTWKSILMGYIDSGIINKNTIFICHSLGPLFVSRILIEEKIRVKGMISVEAAANHIMGNPSFDNINKTFFVPSWEYLDKVKKYLDFNYCFYTDNDPHIPYNILKEYVEHAATKTFFIPNAGHFNTASGYSSFPQLLELIKSIECNELINEIESAYKKKLVDKNTYEILINIGLDKMDFEFYVPTIKEYLNIISKYFEIEDILYSNDIGAENFPLYILKKKANAI